jgi:hypothetical protein
MATYTLMGSTGMVDGPLSPIAVPGNPTKAGYTLALTGPATGYASATVIASPDGQVFIPIQTVVIEPQGPNTVTVEHRFADNFIQFDALLNYIVPGGQSAGMTMTV